MVSEQCCYCALIFTQLICSQSASTEMMQFVRHFLQTMAPFSKEDEVLIKTLYERKGYNAGQFMTEFPNKGWTKTLLLLKLRKYGTVNGRNTPVQNPIGQNSHVLHR